MGEKKMRVLFRLVSLATVVALSSSAALAQGQFRFGANDFLLGQKSVQKELKLSEEQIKKVEDLSASMGEKFIEALGLEGDERRAKWEEIRKENEKAVEILKPEQSKRLKQIAYQQQGAGAFANAEVEEALKLTNEQKQEVAKINHFFVGQTRELIIKGVADEEGRKKIEELRKDASEKVVNLLSDEQKAKWKDLQGEPFKGELRFTPPVPKAEKTDELYFPVQVGAKRVLFGPGRTETITVTKVEEKDGKYTVTVETSDTPLRPTGFVYTYWDKDKVGNTKLGGVLTFDN
jgi:hypothetical protein